MSNTDTDPTQLGLPPNLGDPSPVPDPRTLRPGTPPTTPWQNDPRMRSLGDRPQPRALPPAIGNFLENIGAFVPRDPSRPPQQGMPPPTWPPTFRENRRQMYVPSQANRPATEFGKPPRFPQQPDMWQVPGIYEGVGRQLGRWGGSQRTRLMAGNLSRFTNAYMQGSQRGQREYSRIQHQRMTEAADALQGMLQSDLQNYGSAYNTYGGDPQQLQTDLLDRATQLGDTEMQAALNLGPREAERLLQWRQAKYDDLSRSNTARREHDENLRARNPWLINPVGPDGTPTERLPLPKELDPNALSLGERVAGLERPGDSPGTMSQAPDVFNKPFTGSLGETPPETTNDPRYEPIDPEAIGRPPDPGSQEQNQAPTSRRDDRVRLAQADTGTATDATTLPQITVRPDEQPEEDEDGRTVWDDVRLRSQLREARGQGGTSGGQSDQPPTATGAQPPQPSPAGQPQGAAGQRGPGQPTGATAQAPDQSVPPQAATPTAPAKPQVKAPARGVSPAADRARADGQNADFIEGFGAQWAIGQQSTSGMSRSGIPKEEREAILRRGTEIRNKMFGIINDPNLKEGDRDAVLAAIDKENPQIGAEMRGIVNGSITPKKDTPYWVYAMAHKIDPNINETTFRGRSEALKLHTTGKMGENKMKLGTAMYHADRLLKNLERLPGRGWILERGVIRMIPFVGGGTADMLMPETSRILNEIQTDIDTLNNEYHNVMAYRGNGTLTERKDLNARMSTSEPNALRGTVTEMIEEMKGRNQELKRNFEVGYGGSYGKVMGNYNLTGSQQGADDDDRNYSDQGNRLLDQPGQGRRGGIIDFRDLR